jgi:glucose/arabinose dehydrogenase
LESQNGADADPRFLVTKGLDHPWGMAFAPGGDILVTERPGRLRLIHGGVLDPTPVGPLPAIRSAVLGGLLDVALHPRYSENHFIYFVYSKPGAEDAAKATTAVARARWNGGTTLEDVHDIFVAEPYFGGQGAPRGCCGQGPSDGSYGSRLAFDRACFLYVTLGDRNYGELSQDLSVDIGKIVRLRDDGSVPPDNPFAGKAGYRPELYTIGHRNPLGLTVHPVTGALWSTEFGPRGGDELNLIQAGKNYGWIKVTKGEHYNAEPSEKSAAGMEDPVLSWVPSINPGNITFYNGDRFAAWKGNLLMATMTKSVVRIPFDAQGKPGNQEKMLTELNQRFRDIRTGPDGFLYVLTDETFGAVLRIEPGR